MINIEFHSIFDSWIKYNIKGSRQNPLIISELFPNTSDTPLSEAVGEHLDREYCQTPVLGLGLGVDFTFAWDNNKNHKKNPHLNFLEVTVTVG